jgi:hypothetical protein
MTSIAIITGSMSEFIVPTVGIGVLLSGTAIVKV